MTWATGLITNAPLHWSAGGLLSFLREVQCELNFTVTKGMAWSGPKWQPSNSNTDKKGHVDSALRVIHFHQGMKDQPALRHAG